MAKMASISFFDQSPVHLTDPSCHDGFKVVFEKEIPVELRQCNSSDGPQLVGILEVINFKLCAGPGNDFYKCELSSESDIFFHYVMTLDEDKFLQLQGNCSAISNSDFPDLPQVLSNLISDICKEPHLHLAVFVQMPTKGRLEFIQCVDLKFLELFSCLFDRSSEDVCQQFVKFRYSALKVNPNILLKSPCNFRNLIIFVSVTSSACRAEVAGKE